MAPPFPLGVMGARENMPLSIIASTVVFTAICIALDVRTRRIPNTITGPAIVLGAALNLFHAGLYGLVCSLAGLLITTVILLGPFELGGIGGGDVILGLAPLFHITGLVAQLALSHAAGVPLILFHRFDAATSTLDLTGLSGSLDVVARLSATRSSH